MAEQLGLFTLGQAGTMTDTELLGAACGQEPRNIEPLLSDGLGQVARRAVGDIRYSIDLALELARRVNADRLLREVRTVKSASDVAQAMEHRLRGMEREELWIVILDIRNHILGVEQIYKGNVNSSIVRPAEIFKPAIIAQASSIILIHNHPSGDPTPSADDARVTKDCVQCGRLLDIDVLDHLVIGDERHGYVSMRERRLGFE